MAQNSAYIVAGPATVWTAAWLSNGPTQSYSYTEVGHTKGNTTVSVALEDYEVKSEQAYGVLKKIPISAGMKLKVVMSESSLDNLKQVLRQASGNLTGSNPNKTLLVGAPREEYWVVKIEAKGPGTNALRTARFWKCFVESVAEIAFGKTQETTFEVTFGVMYDESVTTADKFANIVDT